MSDNLNSMFVAMQAKAQADVETRRETVDGEEFLVLPTVAMKCGVLNNVYYSSQAMKRFANAWNGVPVPVGHPEVDGVNVSANSPEFEETTNIGRVYNATYAKGRLKCELWLNVAKAERLGFSSLIEKFETNREIGEVSTGLYSDVEMVEGRFNNQSYSMVASNLVPDHIAILRSDETGACSVDDGCGVLRNNKVTANCGCDDGEKKGFLAFIKEKFGFGVHATSDSDVRYALELMIREQYERAWVVDVFSNENYFVFEDGDALYQKFYTGSGDSIALSVEPAVEVQRETRYVVINSTSNSGDKAMSDKEAMVEALVTNADTKFTADDRKWLSEQDEAVLAKLTPNAAEASTDDADAEDKGENVAANANEGKTLNAEESALFNRLAERENARIADLRANVVKHYELDEKVVAAMTVEALEGLASKIKGNANYSGQAGGNNGKPQGETAYRPPSVVLAANTDTTTPAEAA